MLQLDRRPPEPRLGPAVARFGRDARNLRADQLDAVVVELLAQPQPRDLALEEAHGDDARRVSDGPDGFGQGGRRARHFDAGVGAATVCLCLDLRRDGAGGRIEHLRGAKATSPWRGGPRRDRRR